MTDQATKDALSNDLAQKLEGNTLDASTDAADAAIFDNLDGAEQDEIVEAAIEKVVADGVSEDA